MKQFIRSLVKHIRAIVWGTSHRDFLVVFNWHQVTPLFDDLRQHPYTWTPLSNFEIEIDYLVREFRILPLDQAIKSLKEGSIRGRCASITFDDGDASIQEFVIPYLRRLNLPATLFINSAYLDADLSYWFPILNYITNTRNAHCIGRYPELSKSLINDAKQLRRTIDADFYNETRQRIEEFSALVPDLRSRLVSSEWLAQLDRDQFCIGAHGHEHQRFSMMSPEWQMADLEKNIHRLKAFPAYRPLFAVPFGRDWDWTRDTANIAASLGLETFLADGGINLGSGGCYTRIPSDGQRIRSLLTTVMAQSQ
jgi:peptidoglycan/xylan/chitin deacetylase (PgdA/CDA1 family)